MSVYWQTDRVTLLQGDVREQLRGLPAESVQCVVTSPPYAMQRFALYGGVPEADYPAWCIAWMEMLRPALSPAGSVMINIRENIRDGEISDYVHRTRLALRSAGWVECEELIWVKPCGMPVGSIERPRRAWERVLWFSLSRQPFVDARANGQSSRRIGCEGSGPAAQWLNGSSAVFVEGRSRSQDWFEVSPAISDGHGHPAAFPVGVPLWLIRMCCLDGGTVLDPFCSLSQRTRLAIARRTAIQTELPFTEAS